MVKFVCENPDCPSKDVEHNFVGNPATAECGGCGQILPAQPSDLPEPDTTIQVN